MGPAQDPQTKPLTELTAERNNKMNIYVGNLPYSVTQGQLQALFEDFGAVSSVNLITDKYSGESKGFGFVEMDKQNEAEQAIKTLNGQAIDGRSMTVNMAKPKNDRSRSKSPRW